MTNNTTLVFLCLNADLLNQMDLDFLKSGSASIILRKNIRLQNVDVVKKNADIRLVNYSLSAYVKEALLDTCNEKFNQVCILCRDINADISYFAEIITFALSVNKQCEIKLIDSKNNKKILTDKDIEALVTPKAVPVINNIYKISFSVLFVLQFLLLLIFTPVVCLCRIFKKSYSVCIAKRVHSNQSYIVGKGLKELGVKTVTLDLISHSFGYNKCDISKDLSKLNPFSRFIILDFYFLKFFFTADIFLFENNGESFFVTPLWKGNWFLPSWFQSLELFLFKLSGKKIIFEMRDCSVYNRKDKLNNDVRNICKECDLNRIKGICANKEYIKANKIALKYADFVFCSTPELKEYLPKETVWLPNGYIFSDRENIYSDKTQEEKKIKIVHASSARAMKGTNEAILAVDLLKKKYDIDFVLIEKMSNAETIEHIKSADIVIGQLSCGVYGNFEIESMANAKPVICYTQDYFYGEVKVPFINVDGNDIVNSTYKACEKLILDKSLRKEYSKRSYDYALKIHDYKNTAITIKNVMEHL